MEPTKMSSPEFIEDFTRMRFLNDPFLKNNDQNIELQVSLMNVRWIGVFFVLFTLCSSIIAFFMLELKVFAFITVCELMATFMFFGLFQLLNSEIRRERLPFIDANSNCLVLPSGTRIPGSQINELRLQSVSASNFRIVLISVIAETESGIGQYAVAPVVGRLKDVKIVDEMATLLGATIVTIDECVKDREILNGIGIY